MAAARQQVLDNDDLLLQILASCRFVVKISVLPLVVRRRAA